MKKHIPKPACCCFLFCCLAFLSCYKKEIQFGTTPSNTDTRLVVVDTVATRLSTLVLDSVITNGQSHMLLGRYKDPFVGVTTASPFFQIGAPSPVTLPESARYDSIVLVVKLSKYYLGDTTTVPDIQVWQLAEPLSYTYSTDLYNTSRFAVVPRPLGSRKIKVRPAVDDSLVIRLDDPLGQVLLEKIRRKDGELSSNETFLNYFHGLGLSFSLADSGLILGISSTDLRLRLHYSHNIPINQPGIIEFPVLENDLRYTQLLRARTTQLAGKLVPGKETDAAETEGFSFSQPAQGILSKITFPSLRNLLLLNKVVRLVKAELVVRPVLPSRENDYPPPPKLRVAATDGSNRIGDFFRDGAGHILEAPLVMDPLFRRDNYYRFDMTSYIQMLLTQSGRKEEGLFLLEEAPGKTNQMNKLILGNSQTNHPTQLVLTLLTLND